MPTYDDIHVGQPVHCLTLSNAKSRFPRLFDEHGRELDPSMWDQGYVNGEVVDAEGRKYRVDFLPVIPGNPVYVLEDERRVFILVPR